MSEEEKPLKIREAADTLGVDYILIRGAIERGELVAFRVDDSFRIRPADLETYRQSRRAGPPDREGPPPVAPPPESPEWLAARQYAARAGRWSRRSAGGLPPRTGGGNGGPGR